MWRLTLITPPAVEPVTLAEAKLHARVDDSDENTIITSLITVARKYVEKITNRALITQTWEQRWDDWPDEIQVKLPPIQSVTHIKYLDTDGVEQTLSDDIYQVDLYSEPARITTKYGETWPSLDTGAYNTVILRWVTGYGDTAADVPEPIRQAMLIMISHWFENREPITMEGTPKEIPMTARYLLAPYIFQRFP